MSAPSERETPPTPATPLSDKEWERMLIAIRYVVRRAWELCDDSEETNTPTTSIRTASLRTVSEGLAELEALIPDEQGPASAGVAVTLVMRELTRLRAEASRLREAATRYDLSVICRDCGTLVGGVEAGDRVRFVTCRDCRSGNFQLGASLRAALATVPPGHELSIPKSCSEVWVDPSPSRVRLRARNDATKQLAALLRAEGTP